MWKNNYLQRSHFTHFLIRKQILHFKHILACTQIGIRYLFTSVAYHPVRLIRKQPIPKLLLLIGIRQIIKGEREITISVIQFYFLGIKQIIIQYHLPVYLFPDIYRLVSNFQGRNCNNLRERKSIDILRIEISKTLIITKEQIITM